MTRSLAALALLLLASCATAATLTVRGTMPATGMPGSCAATGAPEPIYGPVWLHVRWVGPLGGRAMPVREDSVASWPGLEARWRREVEGGVYSMTVWASNRIGAGCDTAYADTAMSRPSRVRVGP